MNMFKKILVTSALGLALGGATQFAQAHPVQAAGQTGYVNVKNVGWRWLENGHPYTGFRYYMGTYYWFINGVRQDSGWRHAWGMTYYTDANGRAVQGNRVINGVAYNFGNNGTFFLRGKTAGYTDAGQGWKWYENGLPYTGIRNYMGAYYYFGNNGTFYLRTDVGLYQTPIHEVPQINIGHFPTELQGTWYRYNNKKRQYSVMSIDAHNTYWWTEDRNGRRISGKELIQSTDSKYDGYFQHSVVSSTGQKSASGNTMWWIVDYREQYRDYYHRQHIIGATDGIEWWLSNVDSGGQVALNWYERQGSVLRYIRTRTPIDYSKVYQNRPVPDLGV